MSEDGLHDLSKPLEMVGARLERIEGMSRASEADLRAVQGTLERIAARLDVVETRIRTTEQGLDELGDEVRGVSSSSPGLALRMDRIERRLASIHSVVVWLLSGGFVSTIAAAVTVWKLLEALGRVSNG